VARWFSFFTYRGYEGKKKRGGKGRKNKTLLVLYRSERRGKRQVQASGKRHLALHLSNLEGKKKRKEERELLVVRKRSGEERNPEAHNLPFSHHDSKKRKGREDS